MFAPIQKLLGWYRKSVQSERPNPYNLDDRKIERLKSLWLDDDFRDVYLPLIDVAVMIQSEALLAASPEETERILGKIWGLREAVILVDRIVTQQEKSQNVERRRDDVARARHDAVRSSLYGSPFWSAERS